MGKPSERIMRAKPPILSSCSLPHHEADSSTHYHLDILPQHRLSEAGSHHQLETLTLREKNSHFLSQFSKVPLFVVKES